MTAADEAYDRPRGLDGYTQSPARALRDAAQFFEREMAQTWGGDAQWLTTGRRVAGVVADVLREEAADLEDANAPAVTPRYTSDDTSPTGSDFGRLEAYVAEHINDSPAALRVRATEAQWNALEMARKADQAERRAEEAEFHVEQLRDALDSAERRIERTERLIDSWEHDAPDHSNPVFIGRLRECLRRDPAPLRLRWEKGCEGA